MKARFLRPASLAGTLALAVLAHPAGAQQPLLEDRLGRTLVGWRPVGDYSFVTVQKIPRHCELVIRVRRLGRSRNPGLELWRADKVIAPGSAGTALVEPMRSGPIPGEPPRELDPQADFEPVPPAEPWGRRRPTAQAAPAVRLARWQNLSQGQTWTAALPPGRYIGLVLRAAPREKHPRAEFYDGYHTLRYRSGWAFDVWVVYEDEWLDD